VDIARSLAELAQADRVSFYPGRWDADPKRVTHEDAVTLLQDPRWVSFDTEPDDKRLYYVNVENLPDE
jgi:hypothetical protein